MFRQRSADTWFFSEDVYPPVDFSVRVLRHDGLRVAPFDAHPDGEGGLRDLGLTAEIWQLWLGALIAGHARIPTLSERLLGRRDPWNDPAARAELLTIVSRPSSFCPGPDGLRGRLDELWLAHERAAEEWKTATEAAVGGRYGNGRELWKALRRYHDRLPPLTLLPVDYPAPVVMAVPPATCLIGLDTPDMSAATFRALVLSGAEALAAGPERATAGPDRATG